MRGLVAGLVAWCVAGSSGVAVARNEWVVLRVERVEVAVAHADGSPWDDHPEITRCELPIGSAGRNKAKELCIASGGSDPAEPDLFIRLLAGGTGNYMSGVAPNTTAHDFAAAFLIPLEVVGHEGISLEIGDDDWPTIGASPGDAELMGTVTLTIDDIRDLLAKRSRVKTLSGGSVTGIEVTASRYRARRAQVAHLDSNRVAALTSAHVLAGELVEVRTRGNADTDATLGGRLSHLATGRCLRTIARTAGGVVVAISRPVDGTATTVSISARKPSVRLWKRGVTKIDCLVGGNPVSAATISTVTVSPGPVTPTADQVQALLVRRYLPGIRRCHERGLRRDPAAFGEVRVFFRILATGAATFTNVGGFDSTIDTCIESLIGKWRFEVPKQASGTETIADVEARLSL